MTRKRPLAPGENGDEQPRVRTGNPQADSILFGGFPCNSINIVMGQPGTGKTIFAEQMLFHNAGEDRPSLYVTTLSEPMSKVVTYVQRFAFFDVDQLASHVVYEDLGVSLAQNGPTALLTWLKDAIKTRSPRIIVIDSFRAVHDLGAPADDSRRFISDLAGLLSAYDVTTFLLGEYTQDDIRRYPEFAVADSIVELAREVTSTRDERYFRVLKLRGSSYREGQHAFRITSAGLEIYPRLVAPRVPEHYVSLTERLPTGVRGLDGLMGGGVFAGSTTLVLGMTGAGKTTMALQFALEGVRRGERALYINFQENPAQLRKTISSLGSDPEAAERDGLALLYASPVELQIDSIVTQIFETIRTGKVRRLVIDAVGDLALAANDSQRLHDYMYSLIQHFAVRGVATIITLESESLIAGAVGPHDQRLSYMCDNLVHLGWHKDKPGERVLRVVKMRGSDHESRPRDFAIDAHGLRVT